MRLAFLTREHLLVWDKRRLSRFILEGLLDGEGRLQLHKLPLLLKAVRNLDYLAVGPELALLRTGLFPNLPGFPLDEAVLAEAERSPLLEGQSLTVTHLPLGFEDRKTRLLYAAMPEKVTELLSRSLRLKALEPLPLFFWRQIRGLSKARRHIVLENLSHTIAYFEDGGLVGFRYLSLPVDQASPALADEVVRSIGLFGGVGTIEEAWLVGLPEAFDPPPGLPVEQVYRLDKVMPEYALTGEPYLNLRHRPQRVGEGLPRQIQVILLVSAVVATMGLLAHTYLQTNVRRLERLYNQLKSEQAVVVVPKTETPQGVGLEGLLGSISARPDRLWFTRFEASREQIRLQGEALSPYAPLELAQALGARLVLLEEKGGARAGLYTWEVQLGETQAR